MIQSKKHAPNLDLSMKVVFRKLESKETPNLYRRLDIIDLDHC
jgi:hypothetical protein